MTKTPNSVEVYGTKYTPAVGSYLIIDGRQGESLMAGDDFSDSGYAGSMFRLPVGNGPIKSVAIDVKLTGRTLVRKNGGFYIRCLVTFIGDCEPDTTCKGFVDTAGMIKS